MAPDGSVIVTPGAKIVAIGTRDEPIVFTSAAVPGTRLPATWGALALVGKSPGNWGTTLGGVAKTQSTPDANDWPGGFPYVAGGDKPDDSSGTLKYVRLEYGGAPRLPGGDASTHTDHEMLGLYGVGSGTTLDYIDIRQSNFECFFAEGGNFNARHMVCQYSGNGGFGFTRGNSSRVQFLLDQESPNKAAEGIGLKGPFDGNQLAPLTDPKIYNVTVCGTNGSPASVKDPYALFMNRKPWGTVANFIGVGFHAGSAMLRGNGAPAGTQLHSSILFGNFDVTVPNTNIAYTNGTDPNFTGGNDTDMTAWFDQTDWKNSTMNPQVGDCFDADTLRAAPATAITTSAATPPDDDFFDKSATYIGAIRDANDKWATGNWIVWSAN
jgi:hypothetical protein